MTGSGSTLPPLAISLFGPFDARVDGHPLPRLRSRKGYWLLALLTLRHGREVERSWLAGTLWLDSPEPLAFASLRKSLKDLRRALGPEASRLRSPTPHTLSLDVAGADVDVIAFDTAVARGDLRSLEEAVSLYRGPLLEGWAEEWVFQERQAREEAYLRALEQLAAGALASADGTEAARYLRLAIRVDPSRETAQRELMAVLAASGNYAAAMETYRELRLHLHREQNAAPAPETVALFEQIRLQARERGSEGGRERASEKVVSVPSLPRSLPGDRPPPLSAARAGRGSPVSLPPSLAPSPGAAEDTLPFLFTEITPSLSLEPVGGAVPLESPFYVERTTDEQFRAAIARRDSIVLVKGAQGVGKTSLLARGLQQARQGGARVAQTDLDKLSAAHLASDERFFLTLAEEMADQLEPEVSPEEFWNPRRLPTVNLERYMAREVLGKLPVPVVWGLDGVDRLFAYDFGTEAFRLFRSWHNERALDPSAPWARLTLAIAYATEAHLFIRDLNQSPFNVGTRLALEDFTAAEVADLNARCGSPLAAETEVAPFYHLVGGHPYLVRRGLHDMATRGLPLADLEAHAADDGGIFGDHLQRLHALIVRDLELCEVVRGLLQGQPCPTPAIFYRLRSAGVVTGDSARDARLRCPLYASYLQHHML